MKRFLGRGYDPEDLFQIGVIGLMKAIDKFDLKLEVRFSTYAVPMITGEIKRFLRDDGLLKVSRTIKEDGLKVRLARQRLQAPAQRTDTAGIVKRSRAESGRNHPGYGSGSGGGISL